MIKYKVTLKQGEREELSQITSRGSHKSQKILNALILLNCDVGEHQEKKITNEKIAEVLNISTKKIDRVKKRFVEEGLEIALNGHKGTRVYKKKVDGEVEAHLVALCCSEPPEGFSRWSLRLLADKAVELEYVDSISHETVRRLLKKNELKPWKKKGWVIPPLQNGDFVANMEKVLEVYKRPYDARFPVVCMDESPKQLIKETRAPIKADPGHEEKYDYEYARNGVCNIFMANEPLAGKRYVKVTTTKCKRDWAEYLEEIADLYKEAEKITLVMDNLGTHKPGALYETFKPEKAKQIWDRFEFVYTPKHGSWLNMAEIELNVLMGQCLNRRIETIEKVTTQVEAWQKARNRSTAKINWQFTADDARIKLKRLYPTFDD
ncbi:MAG: IS630 family transposase [Kosmotogaceae bacterium]